MQRIHAEFRYDKSHDDSTRWLVLANKRGVCQDFAHVMIACLRSLGGPARYVSGYLVPRAGVVGAQPRTPGFRRFVPSWVGWTSTQPTTSCRPAATVTLAWGRDYSDVSPLRGVIFEAANTSFKSVEITPLAPRRRRLRTQAGLARVVRRGLAASGEETVRSAHNQRHGQPKQQGHQGIGDRLG
jgi:transglutaminase-like putative cysteine protease